MYVNCVDFDSADALNKLLEIYSLEQLANAGMFCEQHSDNKGKAHVWVFSTKPFPKLSAGDGNAIEVKSNGMLCNSFPSIHKSGNRYFPIGNSLKIFNDNVEPLTNDGFVKVVDDILGGTYLNGEANQYTSKLSISKKITEGARHNYLLRYANSTLRRLYDTTPPNIIKKMVQDVNLERCEPRLPEEEVEVIWNDALKFIGEQVALEDVKGNTSTATTTKTTDGSKKDTKSKIQVAFETVRQQAHSLFIDELQIPHVAIPIQNHLEVLPVNGPRFKNWYRMFIFERDGIVLDNTTINDLCGLASAYAASSKYGAQIKLNLRTALNFNFGKREWTYDLVNNNWEFIRITSNGWNIFKDEIIFRRYSNQQAQVYPDRNYESNIFDEFFKSVNINTDDKDSILLLKCYIISLFIPEIQKVVLMLHGAQGAAKSSLEELIKMLVDPSIVKTFTFPRDLNELQQQLSHNYLVYYDNISVIRPWISDELCRAVSGSGSSKRQLYTDDDDVIRRFKRGVGMNGINLAATKPDLLDRSIIIKLERILDGKQRTPEDIWKAFDVIKARLFGYILDILVKVLNYEEQNADKQFKLTRMTEFAKYGEIIARCMGNQDNAFVEAYERNRQIQTEEIIEFSQIATCLMYMMFDKHGEANADFKQEWNGTASQLLCELNTIATVNTDGLNIDTTDRYWPKNGNGIRRRLNELEPTLRQAGLEIKFYKSTDKNSKKIIKIRKLATDATERPKDDNSRSNLDNFSNFSDANENQSDYNEIIATENSDRNHAQNESSDASDASDANMRGSIVHVSSFIKLEGIQQGSNKKYYNLEPTIGDLSIQNNFIRGHLRMRGEGGGRYPTNYLEFIDKVFGPEQNTIEVCSNKIPGLNKGGSCFTVDINPDYDPDLVADAQLLSGIGDNRFSRWRCDPPYSLETAKKMYNTELPYVSKLLNEGSRVVKPGSLLFLLHSNHGPSNIAELKRLGYITISTIPNNETRILNIYVKLPYKEITK